MVEQELRFEVKEKTNEVVVELSQSFHGSNRTSKYYEPSKLNHTVGIIDREAERHELLNATFSAGFEQGYETGFA